MNDGIPLIDLAPLRDGLDGARQVASALNHALENVGFLIIVNHDVPPDLIAQTFDEAQRFHAQSIEEKRTLRMNEHNNGYMVEGRYNVRTSRASEKSVKPDANEAFFLKRERPADDPLVLTKRRFAGPNIWPANLPKFRENVLEYCDVIDAMAKRLMPALALSLDLEPDYFEDFLFRLC